MKTPELLLIAGPNGAGKTTFAREFLTTEKKGTRFLNADEIARGLSPFDPVGVAVQAGRILLHEVSQMIEANSSFALESTLSGRTHVHMLREAKAHGYRVILHFLWLPGPQESIARVRNRVKMDGHHVPSDDIRRRYPRILENLVKLYLPLADVWHVWDASSFPPIPLAKSGEHAILDVQRFFER